jgi:DNA-nicking Smr family endonuclease
MEEWLHQYPPVDKDRGRPSESRTPPVVKRKLLKQPSQAVLDLHGFTVAQVEGEVVFFLKSSKKAGLRKILIIHGKGYHSEGLPVLKKEVLRLLENSPLAGEFGTADKKEGGSGAVWVLLK